MKNQKTRDLEKILKSLFSEKDEFAHNYLSKVFLNFNMDFTPLPIIKKVEAEQITTPVFLFSAEKDIMFPGVKMLKRARKIFPSLKEAVLLKNSKHVQNRIDNNMIAKIIIREQGFK